MASLEEQVGALVRHHRKLAGLTQAQLAERISRQTGTVTRIENGEAAHSFETLSSLATSLEVEVRDFFGAGVHASAAGRNDPMIGIIAKLSSLEADELKVVSELIGVALKLKN